MSISQLKIVQEVIKLSVLAPFAVLYMNEPLKLDYLWAGLCLLGAVYFMFRVAQASPDRRPIAHCLAKSSQHVFP